MTDPVIEQADELVERIADIIVKRCKPVGGYMFALPTARAIFPIIEAERITAREDAIAACEERRQVYLGKMAERDPLDEDDVFTRYEMAESNAVAMEYAIEAIRALGGI